MDYNRNIRILFVDDSLVIRELVESALLELGYLNIESADDGIDASVLFPDNYVQPTGVNVVA